MSDASYGDRILKAMRNVGSTASSSVGWGPVPSQTYYTGMANDTTTTSSISYIIWALIIIFVIVLVLVVVHYTVTPIFNFEGTEISQRLGMSDALLSWNKKDDKYVDIIGPRLSAAPYTLIFDMKVKNPLPAMATAEVATEYVILYKALTPLDMTMPTFSSQGARKDDSSLYVYYDSIKSQIVAQIKYNTSTTGTASPSTGQKIIYTEITPTVAYRVAIVVNHTNAELYINGRLAMSAIYKNPIGSASDYVWSTPEAFATNIEVRNLFSYERAITGKDIRAYGGPALA